MSGVAVAQPSPSGVAGSLGSGSQQPLRRAVYVHVSDLTNAYNIDHAKLEEELASVKTDENKSTSGVKFSVPTELDTSHSQKRLQPPKSGYNICVLVGKVEVVVDKSRVDKSRVRLAEVQVGDETGTVSLRARDGQIDVLQEISARSGALVLRNATIELYQGKHLRLSVSKWGKLSPYPDNIASTPAQPSKMNLERNFSLIDLSVVASDLIEPNYSRQEESFKSSGGRGSQSRGHNHHGKWGGRYVSRPQPFGGMKSPQVNYGQGVMPGYSMYEAMDSQAYSSWPRHPQAIPQHMMMQQQYQMQQHYNTGGQRQMMQSPSLTHSSGIGNSRSFEGHGHAPVPFMLPTSPRQGRQANRSDSPTHARMNPQAATFAPSPTLHPNNH